MGLLTKIMVNDKYGPGDLVPFSDKLTVAVEVHGPAWATADRVSLFVNGKKIKETKIAKSKGWRTEMERYLGYPIAET